MDAATTFPAPEALSDAEASSLYIGYQTGWFALHRRAHIQPGETLLVHAAAGGVGSAAIQLGKAAGATVIGVVGGPEKAAVAKQLGADVVIDRHTEDFVKVVKEVTGGKGADVIYDPVGGELTQDCFSCINWNGRHLVVGFAAGKIPDVALNRLLLKGASAVGVFWGAFVAREPKLNWENFQQLFAWYGEGKLKPHVSKAYPLAQAGAALRDMLERKVTGKVVLVP